MLTYDFGGSWMGKTGIFENLKPTGCESDNRSIVSTYLELINLTNAIPRQ